MSSVVSLAVALVVSVSGYLIASHLIHKLAVARFTVLNELEDLGQDRKPGQKLKGTAVICGGSVAGLLAARVCSSHFEEVVVIDPDSEVLLERAAASIPAYPGGRADPEISRHPRPRLMQTKMIHASQVLNLRALERLFPDFRAWLKTIGAAIGPPEGMFYVDGTLVPPPKEHYPGGMPDVFSMSRSAYETLLRALVARIPNIRFTKGIVTGVTPSPDDGKRLGSVTYRNGDGSNAHAVQKADLIVDCSGSAHAGLTWLGRAGFQTPPKEMYNPHMRYCTTNFSVDPAIMAKIVPCGFNESIPYPLLVVTKGDQEGRVIVISQLENNHVHINMGGWAYKGTTATVADMRDFANLLRQKQPVPQWLFDLFDYLEGEPEKTASSQVAAAGPLYCIKYEEVCDELPCNFVAIGDASMKINPVVGQGVTKAMVGAVVLNSCLGRQIRGVSPTFAPQFFRSLHHKLASTWNSKKLVDYFYDTTEPAAGETLAKGAGFRWFQDKLWELEMAGDREIAWRKFEVIHWIAPPTVLVAPSVLAKVAWKVMREYWIKSGS